ncbi:hypothetical protein NDU88_001710 [Pleurodeles waltl]|uniref:Uncharacterized protein n=1 Tax=Pleurodeles waltl TaxID=8319 RepID=A0AAV7P4P6_PLEWA|nr:hypothetical protein NDU88_001710 [Pleurodeles waltl]
MRATGEGCPAPLPTTPGEAAAGTPSGALELVHRARKSSFHFVYCAAWSQLRHQDDAISRIAPKGRGQARSVLRLDGAGTTPGPSPSTVGAHSMGGPEGHTRPGRKPAQTPCGGSASAGNSGLQPPAGEPDQHTVPCSPAAPAQEAPLTQDTPGVAPRPEAAPAHLTRLYPEAVQPGRAGGAAPAGPTPQGRLGSPLCGRSGVAASASRVRLGEVRWDHSSVASPLFLPLFLQPALPLRGTGTSHVSFCSPRRLNTGSAHSAR